MLTPKKSTLYNADEKQAPLQIREKIVQLEATIRQTEGHLGADPFPLIHTFAGGMYARELIHPQGILIVGKIHKYEHFFLLLKGEISVVTEEGVKRIKAPYMAITPAGTKRVAFAHEDSTVMTIHRAEESTVEAVEKELIAESFSELGMFDPLVGKPVLPKET